jgi:hypothetical protein
MITAPSEAKTSQKITPSLFTLFNTIPFHALNHLAHVLSQVYGHAADCFLSILRRIVTALLSLAAPRGG